MPRGDYSVYVGVLYPLNQLKPSAAGLHARVTGNVSPEFSWVSVLLVRPGGADNQASEKNARHARY